MSRVPGLRSQYKEPQQVCLKADHRNCSVNECHIRQHEKKMKEKK